MFSGSFGVRSIVLCKCSGKYIDIYFNLKITCIFCVELALRIEMKYKFVEKRRVSLRVSVFA